MKTIVYIDGQNFLYGVAERLFNAGIINDKQEVSAVDIPFLMERALPGCDMEIRYYGVTSIQQQTDYGQEVYERSLRYEENLRRLQACLSRTGVHYCAVGNLKVRAHYKCKQCGAEEYKYLEKGVDVGIAVDITKDVLEQNTDHVVLLSSDADLTPALQIVRGRHVKLTYVTFSVQSTKILALQANDTIILRDEDVMEAYARAIREQ